MNELPQLVGASNELAQGVPLHPAGAAGEMTQKGVEIAIGRLATDEALRQRWSRDAPAVLRSFARDEVELSALEISALLGLDVRALEGFALAIDPRLQRAALDPPAKAQRRKRSIR
jgi:hypothetical protein